jgi:hypothetical protein
MIYNELIKIWEACKAPNWDGYGALPVQEATFSNACAFTQALPLGSPPASVGAEPDGHLTLEWYQHPRWTLSISMSPEGNLYYAALFGNLEPQGIEPFLGDIPNKILNLIKTANKTPQTL